MRACLFLFIMLGVLLSVSATAAKGRQVKSPDRRPAEKKVQDNDKKKKNNDSTKNNDKPESADEVERKERQQERRNPCMDKECKRGETCVLDSNLQAKCICIPSCSWPEPDDHRFEVCSKYNVTYRSECELDRDNCLCRRGEEGCSRPGASKINLDYYGPCQELTECTERELKEFPSRMREWLYIVMQQLAQRAEIPDYLDLLDKARKESNHSHAVIWKFCDLDTDPHDSHVSRRELQYTVNSLKALEHCLIPFLDICDDNSDSNITLVEWGVCLGLPSDKINDKCKNIRQAAGKEKSQHIQDS